MKDGTIIDQFPAYTFKYDETQTSTDKLLVEPAKPIFDLFSSGSKIFKETDQRDHIVVNVNQKLYKNYYIARSGGKK